jgi:hypothetical protein
LAAPSHCSARRRHSSARLVMFTTLAREFSSSRRVGNRHVEFRRAADFPPHAGRHPGVFRTAARMADHDRCRSSPNRVELQRPRSTAWPAMTQPWPWIRFSWANGRVCNRRYHLSLMPKCLSGGKASATRRHCSIMLVHAQTADPALDPIASCAIELALLRGLSRYVVRLGL